MAETRERWGCLAVGLALFGCAVGAALARLVAGGAVVRHVMHPRRSGDLSDQARDLGPFTPDTAVFEIRGVDRGEPWRPFCPVDAAR